MLVHLLDNSLLGAHHTCVLILFSVENFLDAEDLVTT